MSVLFTAISMHLEQSLAHSRYSVNIYLINQFSESTMQFPFDTPLLIPFPLQRHNLSSRLPGNLLLPYCAQIKCLLKEVYFSPTRSTLLFPKHYSCLQLQSELLGGRNHAFVSTGTPHWAEQMAHSGLQSPLAGKNEW